jgi:AAA domain-containing protein
VNTNVAKPITHQGNIAKLPRALAPLIERPQWAVWRWTQLPNGKWQKPPFQAAQPDRHVSTNDPGTWSDYATALATVQAGHADGITYVLTPDDPFAAIDLDHCRCLVTHSIDGWAQNWLDTGRNSYQEVTPSGEGCRIWGIANGDPLNRKFTLEIDGKQIAAELFRRTNKALTITGATLDPAIRELGNINKVIDWGLIWGERRKAAAAPGQVNSGNGFDSSGCKYSIEEIEKIVREGAPAGADRSAVFHAIVGHYVGCGWEADRIFDHLQQHPQGVGERYIAEDRLRGEVERSAGKYAKSELPPWSDSWEAKAPPEPEEPEVDDPDLEDDELDEELSEQDDPNLPPLYAHGDPDPRPIKGWLIKKLMATVGHGLISGQWGTGKTFVSFELAAALMTGQPFVGHTVKRQCGVLFIAAEGADEVRLRLGAVVREKCGNMTRAPFRWYETAPVLLQKDATEKLIAMARQAEKSLQAEFELPLGLIIVDTLTASAGYSTLGAENDIGIGQALMNTMKAVAAAMNCFVLGVGHLGKDIERGTRGAGSKEDSGDLVLYCLGDKELSGAVTNTRLTVRKNRGGKQGQQYPFVLREVTAPEPDEDGEPITTMVVDWTKGTVSETQPGDDPWAKPKRQDQRTAALRLKRVLMTILAEQGVDLPIEPGGPAIRMADQKLVRKAFYACTPVDDGSPKQTGRFRRQRFLAALDWAEQNQLIGVGEINDITYLWLVRPKTEEEELE